MPSSAGNLGSRLGKEKDYPQHHKGSTESPQEDDAGSAQHHEQAKAIHAAQLLREGIRGQPRKGGAGPHGWGTNNPEDNEPAPPVLDENDPNYDPDEGTPEEESMAALNDEEHIREVHTASELQGKVRVEGETGQHMQARAGDAYTTDVH
eukprot:jgi/Chlat1/2278/Chrsp17S02580